jgi:hypothetical protein
MYPVLLKSLKNSLPHVLILSTLKAFGKGATTGFNLPFLLKHAKY